MNCNVGNTDRMLRIGAGVVLIAVGVFTGSWWGAIGLVPLTTGLMRWCPAYTAIGVNTSK